MKNEIIELQEDVTTSPLYSEDLAPVPKSKRTWSVWSLAALWVGMAVCIPTYMLASNIILNGINWLAALIIIGLANVIITIPMVLSGHAGVKYGIPFPVLGRSSFGHNGVHIPAIIRGLIAAVWFGIQTWIGGISIYSIWCALSGNEPVTSGYTFGQFVGFGVFWLLNVYFIWKGTESIKWLEMFAAPILVVIGIALIVWGSNEAGSFSKVLDQGQQLEVPGATLARQGDNYILTLKPIKNKEGKVKADQFQVTYPTAENNTKASDWIAINNEITGFNLNNLANINLPAIGAENAKVEVQVRSNSNGMSIESKKIEVPLTKGATGGLSIWPYLVMLTAMVGFWATMSISIADITRYSKTQKEQVLGQFIGLPGTMVLYSFVGIFVTCAAVVIFDDVLLRDDAPWDPAALLSKFNSPKVVIISQLFLMIATLSTNIAANVIAPANAFANAFPKKIGFTGGGIITAVLGIIICPWWIINHIVPFLLFVSSLLGPVVAILICDYFVIRKTNLNLAGLFQTDSEYRFSSGFNPAAMIAFAIGVVVAGIGRFVPALSWLYDLSWFSGFLVSFIVYYLLMKKGKSS